MLFRSRSDNLFSQFKGGFAENFVCQALAGQLNVAPRYWTNNKPKHEVEYLTQISDCVVPIEVKSTGNVEAASIKYYARKYAEETPLRVRCSLLGLRQDDDMLNIPLYLVDNLVRLVTASLEDVGMK